MKQLSSYFIRPIAVLGTVFALAIPAATLAQAEDDEMIVNGTPAKDGAYPWQVRLYETMSDPYGFCGGSIIDAEWILTAAHCVENTDAVVIGYGSNDREKTTKIAGDKIIIHPDYSFEKANKADVALIHLEEPISDPAIIAVADANADRKLLKPGTTLTVSGWGAMWDPDDEAMMNLIAQLEKEERSGTAAKFMAAMRDQGPSRDTFLKLAVPRKLHEVDIQVIDHQECKAFFDQIGMLVGDTEICAMQPGERNDSCYGDSGGPLVVPASNKLGYVQVGVVSWGIECGNRTFPGVYARLSSYNDWIKDETGSP
ncbi:MAG: serine protease [Pseudomonadota bacterium]